MSDSDPTSRSADEPVIQSASESSQEPAPQPVLIVRQEHPFNAGPPLDLLCQSFVTPNPLVFVRGHGTIARLDPAAYTLASGGLVTTPLRLSLDELCTHAFPAAA
jgi:sulfite oxidase